MLRGPIHLVGAVLLGALAAVACRHATPGGYVLSGPGESWREAGGDEVLPELRARYPEYFAVILDPDQNREPDLDPLRSDLEHTPVDQRNFDALNAVAIGYFELGYRAERGGASPFADSFRAAKLVAIPWRAYGATHDAALRNAILDFFEDAAAGGKLGTSRTAPRVAAMIASLEAVETDPARLARIRRLGSAAPAEP